MKPEFNISNTSTTPIKQNIINDNSCACLWKIIKKIFEFIGDCFRSLCGSSNKKPPVNPLGNVPAYQPLPPHDDPVPAQIEKLKNERLKYEEKSAETRKKFDELEQKIELEKARRAQAENDISSKTKSTNPVENPLVVNNGPPVLEQKSESLMTKITEYLVSGKKTTAIEELKAIQDFDNSQEVLDAIVKTVEFCLNEKDYRSAYDLLLNKKCSFILENSAIQDLVKILAEQAVQDGTLRFVRQIRDGSLLEQKLVNFEDLIFKYFDQVTADKRERFLNEITDLPELSIRNFLNKLIDGKKHETTLEIFDKLKQKNEFIDLLEKITADPSVNEEILKRCSVYMNLAKHEISEKNDSIENFLVKFQKFSIDQKKEEAIKKLQELHDYPHASKLVKEQCKKTIKILENPAASDNQITRCFRYIDEKITPALAALRQKKSKESTLLNRPKGTLVSREIAPAVEVALKKAWDTHFNDPDSIHFRDTYSKVKVRYEVLQGNDIYKKNVSHPLSFSQVHSYLNSVKKAIEEKEINKPFLGASSFIVKMTVIYLSDTLTEMKTTKTFELLCGK